MSYQGELVSPPEPLLPPHMVSIGSLINKKIISSEAYDRRQISRLNNSGLHLIFAAKHTTRAQEQAHENKDQ